MHGGKSKHSLGGSRGTGSTSQLGTTDSFLTPQVNGDNLSGVLETLKCLLDSDQGGLLLNQQQEWTRLPMERHPMEKLSRQAGCAVQPKSRPRGSSTSTFPPASPCLGQQAARQKITAEGQFLLEQDWRHTGWWQGQGQSLADF